MARRSERKALRRQQKQTSLSKVFTRGTITWYRKAHFNMQTQSNSPVFKLHHDVLGEIFKHVCMPPESEDQAIFPPTRLGAVCTYWRQVAWSTPQLWTRLFLTEWFWLSRNRISVLNLYFRNMGGLMLDLTICDYPRNPRGGKRRRRKRTEPLVDAFPELLPIGGFFDFPARDVFNTIFVQHSDKLVSVVMNQYVFPWLYQIEDISKLQGFPNLETFGVRDECDFEEFSLSDSSDPPVAIHNAPRLTNVLLMGLQNLFTFPWSQMVSLYLCAVNAKCAMQAVLQCINLEDLSIAQLEYSFDDETILFPQECVALSRLRSFEFFSLSFPDFWEAGLADHLAFPALQELLLKVDLRSFQRHADFLRNLPPSLSYLQIHCNHTKACTNLLKELFRRWESLRGLTLVFDQDISPDLVKSLIVTPKVMHLPALTHFTLAVSGPDPTLGRKKLLAILELVRSRWRDTRPNRVERISKLVLMFRSQWLNVNSWPKQFKSGIGVLVKEGLEVEIVTSYRCVYAPWLEK